MVAFLRRATADQIKKSPEYREAVLCIEILKNQAKSVQNKQQRRSITQKTDELEQQLNASIEAAISLTTLDDWLVKGINDFIETFFANSIHIRLYPFKDHSFHFLGNLKRDCFTDISIDDLTFAYGTAPNFQLTMFGLIT